MEFPKYNEPSAETQAKRALAALHELLPDGEFEWRGKSWIDMKMEFNDAIRLVGFCKKQTNVYTANDLHFLSAVTDELIVSAEYLMKRAPSSSHEQEIKQVVSRLSPRI